MRIIAGEVKGKKLMTLEGMATRPTLDRVKEALFNIIQFNLEGANVLDLFAGSGGLGIESLSRGADYCVFCDNSYEAIKVINQNIKNTKYENKAAIINKDYILALKKLSKEEYKFDIIFLDPPYSSDFDVKALNQIIELDLLKDDGIIIIETDNKKKENEILKNEKIDIHDKRQYGRVLLIFVRKG